MFDALKPATSVTPEQFAERLRLALPAGLRSVLLYGSAAAGDHLPGRSDYNVLVVAERLGMAELEALAAQTTTWIRAGNRAPVLFTSEELARSADVFPIELADMRQSRRLLWGDDALAELHVKPEHLRIQLEREMKGKLLELREAFLNAQGKPRRLRALLVGSLPAFLVLFRAAVRLYQEEPPARKLDAVRNLAGHIPFDPAVFETIHKLRQPAAGAQKKTPAELRALFETYLRTIEQVVDAVDRHIRSHPST